MVGGHVAADDLSYTKQNLFESDSVSLHSLALLVSMLNK